MTEKQELLPLGSIVLLEEGLQKLVVVGRGVVYTDQVTGKKIPLQIIWLPYIQRA